jgi:hypothetical protein
VVRSPVRSTGRDLTKLKSGHQLAAPGAMALYVVMRAGSVAGSLDTLPQRSLAVVPPAPVDTCETLFWALDGRDLTILGHRWRVEVFSAVELAGRRYMQLAIAGPQHYMLTLRLSTTTPAHRLIPAVLTWLTHPTGSGSILDID